MFKKNSIAYLKHCQLSCAIEIVPELPGTHKTHFVFDLCLSVSLNILSLLHTTLYFVCIFR